MRRLARGEEETRTTHPQWPARKRRSQIMPHLRRWFVAPLWVHWAAPRKSERRSLSGQVAIATTEGLERLPRLLRARLSLSSPGLQSRYLWEWNSLPEPLERQPARWIPPSRWLRLLRPAAGGFARGNGGMSRSDARAIQNDFSVFVRGRRWRREPSLRSGATVVGGGT